VSPSAAPAELLLSAELVLSGERFRVVYTLAGEEAAAHRQADAICVEQTVEFPADLLPAGPISDGIVGHLEAFARADAGHWTATVSYAVEIAGDELTQLLNVVFGNISIMPGIRVERLELPDALLAAYRGPRFGRAGLRELLDVPARPLVCTALKPLGLSPAQLAELAYQYALGGVDLIKDDHGLADQPFCRYEERVARCAEAVARGNAETGRRCLYLPNVTAPADRLLGHARFARDAGAGGLLIAPGLVGFDEVRRLAADDRLALPILSHPALLGSFVVHPDLGMSHYALFGQIARLAGADACIFPNYGGRFSFARQDCRRLAQGTAAPLGALRPIFPVPAGGMTLERVAEMRAFYGDDLILLIGGNLHRQPEGLVAACRRFVALVSE
jgi:ribulose-bisphosphate carboxylase large chain